MRSRGPDLKFAIATIFFSGCATAPPKAPFVNPWSQVQTTAPGPAAPIGSYSAGCLAGSTELPSEGDGYQTVYRLRNRHYGHPLLTTFIESLGKVVYRARERPFLVGDLSMPRGGPTLSGHASHQIGLDADIWFRRAEKKLSPKERDSARAVPVVASMAVSMVDSKTRLVDPKLFGREQVELLRRFATAAPVDRIFVNPAIKKFLCESDSKAEWIRKLRPWFGHDYHFHVRLRCPAGAASCIPTEPLPEGNGCDGTLEWWWSDEARAEGVAKIEKPLELPVLPPECAAVLGP